MAKPQSSEDHPSKPAALHVFPMSLRLGDVLADESAEWRVIGHPFTTAGGKTVNVRVESVRQPGATQMRAWGCARARGVRRASINARTPTRQVQR
jgi:hypothetical protein